jgi:hypothetical protein
LNWAYLHEDGEHFSEYAGSASFGYDVTDRVGAYIEYFGFFPQATGATSSHYVNTGSTYQVTPDYQLDVRFGIGASGIRPDYFIGIGAARRW